MFPEDFLQRVREAADLPALIMGDGVPLKKVGGHEWKARCPFHTEDTPSFTVNDTKGIFHCFGCQESGDAFGWLIKKRGLTFVEAVQTLAGQCGMTVPQDDSWKKSAAQMAKEPPTENAGRPGLNRLSVPKKGVIDKAKFRPLQEGSAVWRYLTETRKLPAELLRVYGLKETHSKAAFYGRAEEDWAGLAFVYRDPLLPREKNAEVIKCLNLEREIKVSADGVEKRVKVEWRHPEGRKSILFGMETVPTAAKSVVIAEGELDAISWAAYEFHAVSVPSGAGSLGWIETSWEWLARFGRIYLSFDSDRAGQSKLLEAAERLGNERVRLVRLPTKTGNTAWTDGATLGATLRHKDANECLQSGVAKAEMDLAIETAVEIRPERLRGIYDFEDGIWQKFHPSGAEQLGWVLPWGNQHGSSLPFRWRLGEVTIASGHNGHGKSQVLNHIVVDLGWQGVRSLVCSMEMTAPETYRRLIRIATGERKPAGSEEAPLSREEFVKRCLRPLADKVWVYDHVGMADLNEVLEVALYARRRYDIRFIVIDSLMTLKVEIEDNKYSEQKSFMNRLCEFAATHGVHIVLVAHAKKLDTKGNKEHAIPRKYDIAGSADLSNLAWNVMITWRNKKKEEELRELQEEIAKAAKKGLDFWQLTDAEKEAASTPEQRANLVRLMELHDAYILIDKQRGGEGDEPVRKTWFHRGSLQYVERPVHQGGAPRKYSLEKAPEGVQAEMPVD